MPIRWQGPLEYGHDEKNNEVDKMRFISIWYRKKNCGGVCTRCSLSCLSLCTSGNLHETPLIKFYVKQRV